MPSAEIIREQKHAIHKLQQELLNNLGNFTRVCKQQKSEKLSKVLEMVLKVKENRQKRYKTDDEEFKALYLAFHRGTASVTAPAIAPANANASTRSRSPRTRARSTRRMRMRGGMKWIFTGLITTLVFLTSTVDAAIGMSAKSLTKKQIKKGVGDESKAYYIRLALGNVGGSCLPASQFAASAAPGKDTIDTWAASRNHTSIAEDLANMGIEEYDTDIAGFVGKMQAHGSASDLYGKPDVTSGSTWDKVLSVTNAAADNIYSHWTANVGGNTGNDICMYRVSILKKSIDGHAFVGIVRKGSDGKLRHGYIDSNSFAGLVEYDKPWLYVENGFFTMSEWFDLGSSVKISEKPLFQLIDSFGGSMLEPKDTKFSPSLSLQRWLHSNPLEEKFEPPELIFQYENNAEVSANSPTLPGDIFPPLRYDISMYQYFLDMKLEASWLAGEYAKLAAEHKTTSIDIDPTCKLGDRANCKPYKLKKAKSV